MTANGSNSFPTAWIVVAAVAPFIGFAGVVVAGQSGVQMTSHDTSTAGHIVEWAFLAIVVAALLIESGAVVIGVRALWKSPQVRTAGNIIALVFGVLISATFIAVMTMPGGSWLR
jgi:cytochrome c oxidase assembly factor CtaG